MHVPFENYIAFVQCNVLFRHVIREAEELMFDGIFHLEPSEVLYPKRIFLEFKSTNHPCGPTRSDAKYFTSVHAKLAEMWVQQQPMNMDTDL